MNVAKHDNSTKAIAATILEQMGGPARLKTFIDADDFVFGESMPHEANPYLMFSFGSYKAIIFLDQATDTYIFELWRLPTDYTMDTRPNDPTVWRRARIEGVYCDQLVDIFEQETGLYLRV